MSSGSLGPNPAPTVSVRRISEIHTREVLVVELEAFIQAGDREQILNSIFFLVVGALAATLIAWGTSGELSERALAVYVGVTVSLAIGSVTLGAVWWLERQRRIQARGRMLREQ